MTEPEPQPPLEPLARDPSRSAVLLDFDGTLAEIVARPELARPVEGAPDVVRAAADVFGLIAVISGRPTADVAALLGVGPVRYLGLYGLEDSADPVPPAVLEAARGAAQRVEGARVEAKGGSVAIHYRQSSEPAAARAAVLAALADPPDGFEAIEGKMVVELVPAGPRKGGAVRGLLDEFQPAAVLYAGDDLADLEAFAELDRAAAKGVRVVRVAVAGPETPDALADAADLTVDGPRGLVALLEELIAAANA